MDLNSLKSFARNARSELLKIVSLKIESILKEDSQQRRENLKAVKELENKFNTLSKEDLIEEVAYTWFNRFTALLYMDNNGFNDVQVIKPLEGNTRPEILSNAISGIFDNDIISKNMQNIISEILSGRSPSNAPEKETYRLLLVSICNNLHHKMPFLFEKISDYTELLMPDDLLSNSSILVKMRDAMTKDNCQDVEVIGWLYQFYISDKKDEVFSSLKKNKKINPECIPAATQLFTPMWIVNYLVENSLGRLWMLNNPNSMLINNLDFFINHDENESKFLRVSSPEEIKICDPACGSGHMLTYAFDLFYLIYEEEGYDPESIPSLIFKNNLYGIEIDKRAAQLSAFALTMKAREKDKNFLKKSLSPNICLLEKIKFSTHEINEYINEVGDDILTFPFQLTLKQFEESDNYGSLIEPLFVDVKVIYKILKEKDFSNNLFLNSTHNRVLKILHQAEYLRKKYHVVVANPPYMGSKGMNLEMINFLKKNYPDFKSDLFSAFVNRNTKLALNHGQLGFMTPFVWMFISSYEKLRNYILNHETITSLVQLEYSGFEGATVPICIFTLQNNQNPSFKGSYIKLSNFRGVTNQAPKTLEAIKTPNCEWFYRTSSKELQQIPGSPIAYWLTNRVVKIFEESENLSSIGNSIQGMITGDNNKFLRLWFETSLQRNAFGYESIENVKKENKYWIPYNKGGNLRKWYGNNEYLLNWKNEGSDLVRSRTKNKNLYFKPCVTWTFISSSFFSARKCFKGFVWDVAGSSAFAFSEDNENIILGLLCSKLSKVFLDAMNPSLNFQVENILDLPINNQIFKYSSEIKNLLDLLISNHKSDWDAYETSWDFEYLPLLSISFRSDNLEKTFKNLRSYWHKLIFESKKLEENNNKIFIDVYGLKDEITPDIPISEITLTCNPSYRYGAKVTKEDQEKRLCADTLKEYISYSVGCMFGRYSLDEPGLILANQGDTLKDYLNKIPYPKFMPDDDNVIPILELDWFEDDITARFKKFLKITFSDENFEENLRFIENSIGKDIRKYFLNDFYKDHVQTYKKRPIYWIFSSPKGSFNALIYMHRYQRDTVSILLDKYLREFLLKLRAEKNTLERLEISADSSSLDKTLAMKKIQKIDSILKELHNWEKEVIFPLASQRLEINLDDGVKINYSKFGNALKKISGLN